jgi:dTDP-4-amino-4,6-dideoxygalactose transaminase
MPEQRLSVIPELHEAGDPGRAGIRVPFVRPSLPPPDVIADLARRIIESGRLTKGPYLDSLEAAIANRLGVRHAVAVSSCTVGLMLVYRALDLAAGSCRNRRTSGEGCSVAGFDSLSRFGVARTGNRAEPLGEVIIPSFTFLAAPAAIVWNNLRPVFVDVEADTTNVSASAVRSAITPRTVAIAACHNFGNPCDIAGLQAVASEFGLPLVVDAAHGFGASMYGRPVGSGGTVEVFSLSPTKLLVAGEGGLVATNCDCVAHFVRLGREYGNDGTYDALFAGVNGRMPETSAAIALEGLKKLDDVSASRNIVAQAYRMELQDLPGIGFVHTMPGAVCSYKDFSITVDPTRFGMTRDGLRRVLASHGIETRAYYNPPCHRQTAFEHFHDRSRPLPVTETLAARSLALPIGSHVDAAVVRDVCDVIANAKQSVQ